MKFLDVTRSLQAYPEGDAAAQAAAAAAAAAAQTPEQKAAADAAAKTAADKAAADAAAALAATKTGENKDGKSGTTTELTPEQKAAAEAAAAAASAGAPAKYELKLPAGGLLTAKDLTVLEQQARKANLSNDEAQTWIDEQIVGLQAQSDAFKAEALADPDYGGAKMVETQKIVNGLIDRVRPVGHARRESFLNFLNRAGANNSIEVISFLADIAKGMGEDTSVVGRFTGAGGTQKSKAERLFGDTTAKT